MFTQAGNTVFTYTSDIRGITRKPHSYFKEHDTGKSCRYKSSDKVFSFANGSVLKLGYMDSENDVLRYQGQEYDIIALDEATQLTEYQFQTLKGCLRGAERFSETDVFNLQSGRCGTRMGQAVIH